MARKDIKRPRHNSRKRRKLRRYAESPNSKEVLLGFYDGVINHLETLQQGLEVPSDSDIAGSESEVLSLESIESGGAVTVNPGSDPAE